MPLIPHITESGRSSPGLQSAAIKLESLATYKNEFLWFINFAIKADPAQVKIRGDSGNLHTLSRFALRTSQQHDIVLSPKINLKGFPGNSWDLLYYWGRLVDILGEKKSNDVFRTSRPH